MPLPCPQHPSFFIGQLVFVGEALLQAQLALLGGQAAGAITGLGTSSTLAISL